jgi:hypothetical protein
VRELSVKNVNTASGGATNQIPSLFSARGTPNTANSAATPSKRTGTMTT